MKHGPRRNETFNDDIIHQQLVEFLAIKCRSTVKLLPMDFVMVVFRKLKLNKSFVLIGDEFGISESHCSRIFTEFLQKISHCMKELIVLHDRKTLASRLPGSGTVSCPF